MPHRVSRSNGDGTYDHFDSVESLKTAEEQESKKFRAKFFAVAGFAICGFYCYFMLQHFAADLPKWLRVGIWVLASSTAAYAAAKLAEVLWALISLVLMGLLLWGIGTLIWRMF